MSPLAALALVFTLQGGSAEPPRAVVRHSTAAVEGDSVAPVRKRWQRALGLATLAPLTYDYPAAESLQTRLLEGGSAAPDRYTVYARLGQGLAARTRGGYGRADGLFVLASTDARNAGDPAAWAEAMILLAAPRARTSANWESTASRARETSFGGSVMRLKVKGWPARKKRSPPRK